MTAMPRFVGRLGGVSIIALAAGLSSAVSAQELPAPATVAPDTSPPDTQVQKVADPVPGGEIIVTARRRSESLQNVPISISVFTESQIKTANITRPADFVNLTPGVSQVQTLEVGDFQVNVRGINSGRDTESSVALIIDGVLVTNPNALNQELDNVTQIEVLKGPQGALYGRNALAGAIILTTRKPSDHFEAFAKAGVGRYHLFEASGGISGPLMTGIRASLNAYHRQDNGSFYNSFRRCGDCENNSNETGVIGRLIADLGGSGELDLKARYSRVHAGGVAFNAAFAIPGLGAFNPLFFEDPNKHDFLYINRNDTDNRQTSVNLSARAVVDVGFANLTGTLAYNDVKNNFISPGVSNAFGIYNENANCIVENAFAYANPSLYPLPPGGPFAYGPTPGTSFLPPYPSISCGGNQYQQRDQKDWSAEARLTSKESGALRWMTGAYYAHIKRHLVVAYSGDNGDSFGPLIKGFAPTDSRNPTDLLYDDFLYSDVYAGFANAAYNIFDNVELAAAARYDVEKRRVTNNVPNIAPQTQGFGPFGVPVCAVPGVISPGEVSCHINPYYNLHPTATSIPDRSRTFQQLQPKVTLTWKPSPRLTVFASYGYGFRSGGFNSSGTTATVEQYFGAFTLPGTATPQLPNLSPTDEFKKEVSKAAELGFKSTLLHGQLNLSGALFHTIDLNGQDFSFFAGPFGSLRTVTNIDKAVLQGLEADLRFRPINRLTLIGSFSYTDSKIKKYSIRPYTVGNKVPYVPAYTGNIGAEYHQPLIRDLNLIGRVDTYFVGRTWFSPVQNQDVTSLFGVANYSRMSRRPYSSTNATLTAQAHNWDVSFWVTNLFDKKFLAEIIPAPEFGGSFIHDSYGRTFGVRASVKFGG